MAEIWPEATPGTLAALAIAPAALAGWLSLRAPVTGFRHRTAFGVWGASILFGATLLAWAWHLTRVPPLPPAWADLPPREAQLGLRVLHPFNARPDATSSSGLAEVVTTPPILAELRNAQVYYRVYLGRDGATPVRGATVEINGVLSYLPATDAAAVAAISANTTRFHDYLREEGVGFLLERGRLLRELASPSAWLRWTSTQNTHLEELLRRGPPSLEALYGNVYTGLFLGKAAGLDDAQRTAFTVMGVMYLFAISGLHVGIVAGSLWWCLRRVPRLPRTVGDVGALALAWLYVEITGGSPSARRAALMFTFFLAAQWIGRPRGSLGAILAAGLCTVIVNPLALDSPGLQLSYSVVLGLILYAQPLMSVAQTRLTLWRDLPPSSRAPWQKCILWLWEKILASLAISWTALLCSAPLTAQYFQMVTVGSLLSSLLLLPLICVAMGAAVGAIALGLLAVPPFTWLAWLVNAVGLLCAGLMQKIVETTAPIPGVHAPVTVHPLWAGEAATLAVLAVMLATHPRARLPRWPHFLWPVLVLAVFAALALRPV